MKRNTPPEDLTIPEKNLILHWHRKKWPHHFNRDSNRKAFIVNEIDSCLDWHRAEGRTRVDYVAAVRNWIRKSMDRRGYEPYRPPSSKHSPTGKLPFDTGVRDGLASVDDELLPILRLINGSKA